VARALRAPRRARPPARRRLLGLLARLGRGLRPARASDLAARIDAAGLDLAAEQVAAAQAGAALAALAAAVAFLAPALPGRLAWLAVAGAAAGAHRAPALALRRRAAARARVMEAELADVLDLLHVALDAGLGTSRAVAEVGRRHPGLLAGELRSAAARRALGVSHAEMLEDLRRRCPAEGIAALTAALARAERHGAPPGEALAAQAAEARARRARRAQVAAARAAPKIQLVVALLLVPAAMLLVAAAVVPALLHP
jgi:tight adherence protein C